MSYDLTIYFAQSVTPDAPAFGSGSLCQVEGPLHVEQDDIPPEYLKLVGKRRLIWQVNIEGDASDADLAAFGDWLHETIGTHKAVMIDEQLGIFRTARKEGPLPNSPIEPQAGCGSLSIYFEDADAFHPNGLRSFLETLRTHLPEAFPTRYGGFEPMQGKVADGDITALLSDWSDDAELFMKAKTPFSWIFFSLPCKARMMDWHTDRRSLSKNLVGRIEFEIRPKLFSDPVLQKAVIRFMKEAARLTGAFYAELRKSECPVRSWFWRGLPPGPVEACIIGPPYINLWPKLSEIAEVLPSGHALLRRRIDGRTPPDPPERLLMPVEAGNGVIWQSDKFADIYPFPIGKSENMPHSS